MSVVDVPADHGWVTPVTATDERPVGSSLSQRSSASEAHARVVSDSDDTVLIADQLGATQRSLQAAQEMVQRHVATAGEGQAGVVVATIEGVRPVRLEGAGLMVSGRSETLNVGVALLADPLVLLAAGRQQALDWQLLPGGPSVTARADALRFIRSLAASGSVTITFGKRDPLPPLMFDGGSWEDEDEWRLFEDLATLEEWSGVGIPMPSEVSARQATIAAQAAGWVRAQQIEATVSHEITFEVSSDLAVMPDELRLHQTFDLELLDLTIPLGEGVTRLGLRDVRRCGDSTFRAAVDPPRTTFALSPPPGRRLPARRTQVERQVAVGPAPSRPPAQDVRRRAKRSLKAVLSVQRPHPIGANDTSTLLDLVRGD